MTRPVAARGRTLTRVLSVAVLGLVCALILSGCSPNPQTTLSPQSDVGQKIQDLFALTVWLAVAVGVIVEGALLFAVLRFRRRKGQAVGPPEGLHGSTRLEITWTILPTLVLVFLAWLTVPLIFETAAAAPKNSVQVHVTGHQWWWEFKYPQYGITTANELHLPVGVTANFTLDSADVIHSFWIPGLDGKRDIFANHENNLWFTPRVTGLFPGQCAEFCGPAHAFMYMTTVVESPTQFAAWVRHQQQKAVPASTGSAQVQEGARLFAQGTCAGCHTIAGTSAAGNIGPNLTHVGSRFNLSGQLMPNNMSNLMQWIHNSSDFKPGSHMPAQNLSTGQLAAIAAYLESLK